MQEQRKKNHLLALYEIAETDEKRGYKEQELAADVANGWEFCDGEVGVGGEKDGVRTAKNGNGGVMAWVKRSGAIY